MGTVTLNYSVVSGNVASSGSETGNAQGGGIYNRGVLCLQHGTVTHNTAAVSSLESSSADGGGIFSAAGRLVMRYSLVSYNTANGNLELSVTVTGGGIVVKRGSTAIVAYSVIRNNIAIAIGGPSSEALGAGAELEGTATLYRSVIYSNTATVNGSLPGNGSIRTAAGGGLAIPGKAKLYYVAIYGNSTHAPNGLARGGGIEAGGPATLNYSKVANNTAQGATLADSQGGGIYNSNITSGAVILTATQVNNNHPDQCDPTGSVPGCSN